MHFDWSFEDVDLFLTYDGLDFRLGQKVSITLCG